MLRLYSTHLINHLTTLQLLVPGALVATFSTVSSNNTASTNKAQSRPPSSSRRRNPDQQTSSSSQRSSTGRRPQASSSSNTRRNPRGGSYNQRSNNNNLSPTQANEIRTRANMFRQVLALDDDVVFKVKDDQGVEQKLTFDDIVPDTAANTTGMALLKYYTTPIEMKRFMEGTLSLEEQDVFMKKLSAAFVKSQESQARDIMAQATLNARPNYHIEKMFLPYDIFAKIEEEEAKLSPDEALKKKTMYLFRLNEEQYELHKDAATKAARKLLKSSSSGFADAERLAKVVEKTGMTSDHPLYNSFMTKVRVVQNNPDWPIDKKVSFVKQLASLVQNPPTIEQ